MGDRDITCEAEELLHLKRDHAILKLRYDAAFDYIRSQMIEAPKRHAKTLEALAKHVIGQKQARVSELSVRLDELEFSLREASDETADAKRTLAVVRGQLTRCKKRLEEARENVRVEQALHDSIVEGAGREAQQTKQALEVLLAVTQTREMALRKRLRQQSLVQACLVRRSHT